MFDTDAPVTLVGTVKEFQWSNPHCFIQLLVQQPRDTVSGTEEWSIEMGAPAHLVRAGWKRITLKPGDKVSVVIYPLRDGTKGGNYVSGKRGDGMTLENSL